ncbi:hypothetical protein HAX54_014951 [Datura stramonium]|uniref:Uncharacterized protein n=1 Tax=Datura stramonium TaxID=4076 RepID=A0ABS8TQT8_DATST|nr:hypothetical protein [Datura stramonium]
MAAEGEASMVVCNMEGTTPRQHEFQYSKACHYGKDKLAVNVRNQDLAVRALERQMNHIAWASHTRPQGDFHNDIDRSNAITLKCGKKIEELVPKKVGPRDVKAEEEA